MTLRTIQRVFFLLALATASSHLRAQSDRTDQLPVDATKDHLERLDRFRRNILDPQARLEERRNWAEALLAEWFQTPTPQAKMTMAELLGRDPETQRAICEAIGTGTGFRGDQLDGDLVGPLIDLLSSENADLRASAARALAEFPRDDVAEKLGAIARGDGPLPLRLSAIDALAPSTYRRKVVKELIGLLNSTTPEVVQRAATSLETASRENIGTDISVWETWWEEKKRLSEEEWVTDRLRMFRDRDRQMKTSLRALQEEGKRQQESLGNRLRDFQRDLFRTLPADQREAKLIEWLNDPLDDVKLTPLSIIKSRIADEGKRPEGELLATLLRLVRQGSSLIRREVLAIVQNLSDPAVREVLLSQLDTERDPTTRAAIFKSLGRMESAESIPVLLREISSSDSPVVCVREAALALGLIAEKKNAAARSTNAVDALQSRFFLAPAEDANLRAALLTAMAGIGDAQFAPQFLKAVESSDPAILRPALRGLQAVGDYSTPVLMRRHTRHQDPLVRLAAIDAVSELGREESDLECLLARLNPGLESNDSVREAAWRGFQRLLAGRPIAERIRAAAMLRDVPEREIAYLEELAAALSSTGDEGSERELILERLGLLLAASGKHQAAIPYLRELYLTRQDRSDASALDWGLQLIDTLLAARSYSEVSTTMHQVAAAADEEGRQRVVQTVAQHVDSPELVADPERTRQLLNELRDLSDDLLGPSWPRLMQRISERSVEKEPSKTKP